MTQLLTCRLWVYFSLVFLMLAPPIALGQRAPTIERVDIAGNKRVTEDTIRFYLQTKSGDPYDEQRIQADFQALLRLKSFKDVRVEEKDGSSGKIITFHVEEWPLIRQIEYIGNKSFSNSDILEHFKNRKVGLTVDSQYDPGKVNLATRALKELLDKNGRPMGTVKFETEEITSTAVKLKFIIEEGEKVRIGEITFSGNTVFSDGKLRDTLKLTKVRGIISTFKGTDKYDPLKLEADLEQNVRKIYQEHGYVKLIIGTPKAEVKDGPRGIVPLFRKTKEQFFIEVPLVEGDQYTLGELHIKDSTVFKEEVLLPLFGMKKGDVINFTKVRDALEKFRSYYGALGYINWSYLPEQNIDDSKKTVDITFTFQEDKQFNINRIEFAGNTRTRDKVMRREFLLDEKSVFNSKLLELSVLRLNQLGFFERIEEKDYEVRPNPATSEVDITVKVKEKGQQSIGLTGGTSGISGSFVGITYTSNNFRGKGQRIEADVTAGTRTTNIMFSFTEPYFRDSRLTLGFSIFNQRLRYDTFNTFFGFGNVSTSTGKPLELFNRKTSGITLSGSYPLWGWWRAGASYTLQNITITDIREGLDTYALGSLTPFTPTGSFQAALKGIKRSQITPSLSYNTTDHPLDPKHGRSVSLSLDIAGGPLQGDFNLIRPNFEVRQFVPDRFFSGRRNTMAFRLLAGYVTGFSGTPIPLFDRYYSGGENLVRGFDIRSVSPYAVIASPVCSAPGGGVKTCTSPDEPRARSDAGQPLYSTAINVIGGDMLVNANIEYRIPIAGPLAVAAFFDAGTARTLRRSQLGNFGDGRVTIIEGTQSFMPTTSSAEIRVVSGNTNGTIRTSTGAEILFQLPVVNVPFRLILAYNPTRMVVKDLDFKEPRHNVQFTIGRAF
ncbi:MAG: outer membrane protein assembly factor BamA [Acidobacteria bacterium]|nr:outer membrane protein assembly factor BamA [Acidobacteriota bacterium]